MCYKASKRDAQPIELVMASDQITCSECNLHLRITRNIKDKVNVEEKLSIGRKTAYSQIGAGFYSINELKTCLNGHIWTTFVVPPRLVYGLEILPLTNRDIESLEKFQRKSLRQIQGLPDKTTNSITLAAGVYYHLHLPYIRIPQPVYKYSKE